MREWHFRVGGKDKGDDDIEKYEKRADHFSKTKTKTRDRKGHHHSLRHKYNNKTGGAKYDETKVSAG